MLARFQRLGRPLQGVVLMLLVGIVAALVAAGLLDIWNPPRPPPPPTVPDIVGLTTGEAEAALKKAGLRPNIIKVFSSSPVHGVGKIVTQDPLAGASAEVGDSVTVYESKGEPPPSVEIKEIDPGAGGNSRGKATVAVGGFDSQSVVVVWIEAPNDAYYLQWCEQFTCPNSVIAEPEDYYFTLFRPADSPGKSVRVTVHPPGAGINDDTVFKATGTKHLYVVAGSLEAQLRREGYPVVDGGKAGPDPVPAI